MERELKHLAPPTSEITPEKTYLSRRDFIKAAGVAAGSALLAACAPQQAETPAPAEDLDFPLTEGLADELGDPANTYQEISNYNNFYEFSTDKETVASISKDFKAQPWSIEVTGLVGQPRTFAYEDLLRFEQKERIYRLRCVEGWSMVIPWQGFELGDLIKAVEPLASAKYVAFTTVMRPSEMPGQNSPFYPWPYTEGLRLDEAMHRLTLMATGLYGRDLPNQNGAPIRLVVPWKYGFKSIKSIVRIELTGDMPPTLWNAIQPHEYGFYANVNPQVDHPRWSQRTERRIGELRRRDTLLFNGYEEEVAGLYTGMDLSKNY